MEKLLIFNIWEILKWSNVQLMEKKHPSEHNLISDIYKLTAEHT